MRHGRSELLLLALPLLTCRHEPSDGGPDTGCDPATCELQCEGEGLSYPTAYVGRCVSGRCVCACESGACNRYCNRTRELVGGCASFDECECTGCFFSDCYRTCMSPGSSCGAGHVCVEIGCEPDVSRLECRLVPYPCPPDYAPVCACDGTTYVNECELLDARATLDHSGPCDPTACGGPGAIECPEGWGCDRTTCGDLVAGTCMPVPEECPPQWSPVCGCDGATYQNDCERIRAGVARSSGSFCGWGERTCEGPADTPCPSGRLCWRPSCRSEDAAGCVVPPVECSPGTARACGCDGSWYESPCELLRAGVGQAADAVCEGTLCAPECRVDSRGVSFWLYPCSDQYLCEANCTGCTFFCGANGLEAACSDRRTDAGCLDNVIDPFVECWALP